MSEQEQEFINDAVIGYSNCCGAKVYQPDICSDCGEHCEIEEEVEELD